MMKQIENEMNFSVPLEIIKASEIEPKEVKWLWYPYIPFGKVTLLQGDPGDGKSKLMLSVAALLSKGKPLPFAETEENEPMTIIYQTTEDDADDTVVPRFNSAGQMVAEKWFETEAKANDANAAPIAHYKYVYDGDGNIVRSIDIYGKKEYNYEYEEGRIVRAAEADIVIDAQETIVSKNIVDTLRFTYNKDRKIAKKHFTSADFSHTVYYEHSDEDNVVVKFTANNNTVTCHSKTDSFGRKEFEEIQLGSGFVSRLFSYHAGAVTDTHKTYSKLKSTATTVLVSQIVFSDGRTISYEYDNEDRITKVIDSYEGIVEYYYDTHGQLLTEMINGEVVNSMEYDNYGNIVSKNGKAYTYGNATWKDLLTGFDGKTIEYDAQGNPTSYLGHTLTWEKGRLLKSFDGNTYTYNANGIRTSKCVNGIVHHFSLDGSQILLEQWDNNKLVPLYNDAEEICGIIYNSTPYYFIKNLQGDIIAIVDNDAQTVVRYSYDAWGVPEIKFDSSACQIATINPFRYRGYYYDVETHLYYLNKRYYSAELGRWIAPDAAEIVQFNTNSLLNNNLYTSCWNNPTNMADDDGCLPWFVAAAISGAIFDTAVYLIDAAINKKQVTWAGVGTAALKGAVSGVAFGAIGKGIKAIGTAVKATKTAKKFASAGIKIMNKKYANKFFKLSGNLSKKYGKGIKFNKYGFPDFSKYAKHTTKIKGLTGNYAKDAALANAKVGLKKVPRGFTWHHVEDGVTMMLIPSELHKVVRHTGGASLIRKLFGK